MQLLAGLHLVYWVLFLSCYFFHFIFKTHLQLNFWYSAQRLKNEKEYRKQKTTSRTCSPAVDVGITSSSHLRKFQKRMNITVIILNLLKRVYIRVYQQLEELLFFKNLLFIFPVTYHKVVVIVFKLLYSILVFSSHPGWVCS